MGTEMNVLERGQLRKQEKIIEDGQQTFVDVGNALAIIRDEKLYRERHKTFEAYCGEKWNFGKAYAYRLIESAIVVKTSPMGDKIASERQARELGKVPENKRSAVMASALHETGDNPTAGDIRAAAERLVTPPDEEQKWEPTDADRMAGYNDPLKAARRDLMAIIKRVECIDNPHLFDERANRFPAFAAQIRTAANTLRSAKEWRHQPKEALRWERK